MPTNDVELRRTVDRHDRDLYRGDRESPGLTVRMAGVEGRLDNHDKMMTKLEKQGGRILALLVSTLVSILALLIAELVKGK